MRNHLKFAWQIIRSNRALQALYLTLLAVVVGVLIFK